MPKSRRRWATSARPKSSSTKSGQRRESPARPPRGKASRAPPSRSASRAAFLAASNHEVVPEGELNDARGPGHQREPDVYDVRGRGRRLNGRGRNIRRAVPVDRPDSVVKVREVRGPGHWQGQGAHVGPGRGRKGFNDGPTRNHVAQAHVIDDSSGRPRETRYVDPRGEELPAQRILVHDRVSGAEGQKLRRGIGGDRPADRNDSGPARR